MPLVPGGPPEDPGRPGPAAEKKALRAAFLQRRAARDLAEGESTATAVAEALRQHLAGVPTVAAFVPDPGEPGHGRLPAALTELGARVLLPVVPAVGRELSWAVDTGSLRPGRFGLLEPTGPRLPPEELAAAGVVVVPALAVARDGVRLGRGGGFYDRALGHARDDATVVALLFDDEFVEALPTEPHDRRVDAVVTPSGGWRTLP